ncbi:MAG: hypothetical protein K8T25_13805 [Planctomycetia bacterium]|nr:hypothetical protein [Planctomycetia bacterium]
MVKKAATRSDRSDPKKNKSLAIRNVLQKMPGGKATEIAAAVKKDYGHKVSQNMVYMIKTKTNMIADGRPRRTKGTKSDSPITSAAMWIDAIKIGRQLLKATGSVANATALLKAVDGAA